jgi:catechol 2,3-dioxygenase-like lactoylglutathione lyase family enzyme
MTIELNHTIVNCRDQDESARFLVEVLALPEPTTFGPFTVVEVDNGVSLDFISTEEPLLVEHYAFLVDDATWDATLRRITERGITYWADPARTLPGEHNTHDGGRGLYWAEPSGHLYEIITKPYGSGA